MVNSPQKPVDKGDAGQSVPKRAAGSRDTDSGLSERLEDLGSRIHQKRKANEKPDQTGQSSTSAGVARALRLSSEFIAGIVVGAGFGYAVDTLAGTSPWGMIGFLFLGFGAGVLNAMRSAGLIAQSNLHLRAGTDDKRDK